MRAITFFTEGYYEEVFNNYLGASCKKVNYPLLPVRQPNLRDWTLNTRLKAKVILDSLNRFNEDIVFIDADAVLLKYPVLFDEIPKEYDIAVHYLDWYKHWRNVEGHKERELYNAVMMVRNNERVKRLLVTWIALNEKSNIFEQKVLETALAMTPGIKVFDLPIEYACIATHKEEIPDYVKDPVIFQTQISRKIRHDKSLLQR